MVKRLPSNLQDALRIRSEERVIPYFGGTDLMVRGNRTENFLFLNQIPEIKDLVITEDKMRIGAGITYRQVLEEEKTPQLFQRIVWEIASPPLRNMASIIGNVCNASPVGDTLPYFYVLNAELELKSATGERRVPITEFITGARKTFLREDELVTAIECEIKAFNNEYYQKVGPRKACSISKVDFVGLAQVEEGVVNDLRMAFGAVKDTIVRDQVLEGDYIGKSLEEVKAAAEEIANRVDQIITPIDDKRSTEDYRRAVVRNMVLDFVGNLK